MPTLSLPAAALSLALLAAMPHAVRAGAFWRVGEDRH